MCGGGDVLFVSFFFVVFLLTTGRRTIIHYSTSHALELILFDSNTLKFDKNAVVFFFFLCVFFFFFFFFFFFCLFLFCFFPILHTYRHFERILLTLLTITYEFFIVSEARKRRYSV